MAAAPGGLIERYRDRLPFEEGDPVVTLREGSTPRGPTPPASSRTAA